MYKGSTCNNNVHTKITWLKKYQKYMHFPHWKIQALYSADMFHFLGSTDITCLLLHCKVHCQRMCSASFMFPQFIIEPLAQNLS